MTQISFIYIIEFMSYFFNIFPMILYIPILLCLRSPNNRTRCYTKLGTGPTFTLNVLCVDSTLSQGWAASINGISTVPLGWYPPKLFPSQKELEWSPPKDLLPMTTCVLDSLWRRTGIECPEIIPNGANIYIYKDRLP